MTRAITAIVIAVILSGCQSQRRPATDPFWGQTRVPSPGTGSIGIRPADPLLIPQQPVVTSGTPIGLQPMQPNVQPNLLPGTYNPAPISPVPNPAFGTPGTYVPATPAPTYTPSPTYTPAPAPVVPTNPYGATNSWPPNGVPVGNPNRGMAPPSGYSNTAVAPSAAPYPANGVYPPNPSSLAPSNIPAQLIPAPVAPPPSSVPGMSPAPAVPATPSEGTTPPGYLPQGGFNYRDGSIRQPSGNGMAMDGTTVSPPPSASTLPEPTPSIINVPSAMDGASAVTPASVVSPVAAPDIGDLPLRRDGMTPEPDR